MRNAKRTLEGEVVVGDQRFSWRLHREPQWCTADGWRGMVIAVRQADGEREALIEWPMPKEGSHTVPYRQRPKIDTPRLQGGIRQALDAGWDPLSRGKPFAVIVD
ncbi:MAG: hypothetical protein JST54_00985 [Deltaproteobacteria bacterium]|nr:hypothetical protein [Deltaproteobacteria bacterium]